MIYNLYLMTQMVLPRTMIITISISVIAVLILCGIVFMIWQKEEKKILELNQLTDSMDAGVVIFNIGNNGFISYASSGFCSLLGFTREEIRKVYDNSFYSLIGETYSGDFQKSFAMGHYNISHEINIQTGNGIRWFLVTCNFQMRSKKIKSISAVFIDITEKKILGERLMVEQERYRLATELANDVIFYYDFAEDALHLGENYSSRFGGPTVVNNFNAEQVWEKGAVHPDDVEVAGEIMRIMIDKGKKIDYQLRIRNSADNYIWSRIIAMPISGNTTDNIEYVGKIIDIDSQKKEYGEMEKKAQRDSLTGAYNKEYTKLLINRYIKDNPGNSGMLLLVDIDHFKQINDNYGHIMGDNIIVEVVKQVTKIFRSNDIVGRIGGDEFVVFVCNVNNPEDQIKQAKKLHEVLRQQVEIDGKIINKSASIGIAIYPEHADSYEKLVERADEALYKVKDNGRDSFIIYGNE